MKQFFRLMRTISLVMMGLGLVSAFMPFLGLAQEATIAAPAAEPTWLTITKAVVTVAASQLGPLVTKGMAFVMPGIPGWLRPVLSALFGAVAACFAGVESGAMTAEMAAGVGMTGGATGHALMQSKPVPQPEQVA